MAGYSTRALVDKLGVRPYSRVALLGAPDGFEDLLSPVPAGVRLLRRMSGHVDMAVLFTTAMADMERRWPALSTALAPNGVVWVAWPKRTAVKALGLKSDMSEDVVRLVALPTGWVDVKVCALDDTWSGLKCVLRVELRR
ncbi:MAG: DUF3052 family protein [Acidimicrobiales bacterium]